MRFSYAAMAVRKMGESLNLRTAMVWPKASGQRETPENHAEMAFVRNGIWIELLERRPVR